MTTTTTTTTTTAKVPPKKQQKSLLWQLLSGTGLFPEPDDDFPSLAGLPEYTEDEVRSHDSPADCWVIINNYVYDITEFLNKHPGGSEILWEYLGLDATLAFMGSGHSPAAYKMLGKFLVGTLRCDDLI